MYNTGSLIQGVLIRRAANQPFDAFMRERVTGPLGMRDTDSCSTVVWKNSGAGYTRRRHDLMLARQRLGQMFDSSVGRSVP